MKVIKYFILTVALFCNLNLLLSQSIIYSNEENYKTSEDNNQSFDKPGQKTDNSKISYNIEVGSSFTTSKAFGNMLSFYTAPSLKYKLSPKLEIKAGILMINANINSYYVSENQNRKNYSAYMMTGFDYNKERLRISGEILYGKNKSLYNGKNSPDYFARFQAEYKITKNLSVGFQVINQNMNQNYLNQFGNSFYNPYQRFNPYFGN